MGQSRATQQRRSQLRGRARPEHQGQVDRAPGQRHLGSELDSILTGREYQRRQIQFQPRRDRSGLYLEARLHSEHHNRDRVSLRVRERPVVNGHSATWQGLAQYLVYDWNAWEFAGRGEFFDDQDGARTGVKQTLWELTGTTTYKVPEVTGLL